MAYTINKFNGEELIVLDDGTIDNSTSLGLVGRNYVGYGETQNENFVFLLENFANDAPPSRPLKGQLWFNTTNNLMNVYDGSTWSVVGAAELSSTEPTGSNNGALWLRTTDNTLHVWTGAKWAFIGPESAPGFGSTRCRSGILKDISNIDHPVIFLEINGNAIGVCTETAFTINPSNAVPGISNNLIAGINLSSSVKINGSITGNAENATRLADAKLINGVGFDGQNNITIKSSTTNKHVRGTYLTGTDFDGSGEVTWSVDASSSNQIGKVVVRDSAGSFSAGTITADLVGNVSGNVTSTGTSQFNIVEANMFVGATLTGNAFSASQLATARKINGVSFDGTKDITVTAVAGTLTGNTLNSSITTSSLTSVGTLQELSVADPGVSVGSASQLKLLVDSGTPTVRSSTGKLNFDIGATGPDVSFVNSATSVLLGGPNAPAIVGDNTTNLGIPGYKFDKIYANEFKGNADTATTAVTSTNIAGGGAGSIPYQTANGVTTFLNVGANGYILRSRPGNTIQWEALSFEQLTKGSYVNMVNTSTSATVSGFDSSSPVTISVDATSSNTASKIVARDASGNFSAGTITANLVGSITGNAATANKLTTARTINGVEFDGTANITIQATDPTKVAKTGDSMSGYLTLNGDPVNPLHATPKQYVDSRLPRYDIRSGASYSIAGYTNIVGSWSNDANYFDVFPPVGRTMVNLVAFIPSIHAIHYAGAVNGDDSMRCSYSYLGDRIRVYVQNTEQRSTPAANWLAIWSY